ncbi:MAG: gliding motility lipoprotein GldH [Sphingobacteriales bacterium]|nr:MAG: gliding motility lipoprotein GldH [Sphingobacteriales bacterium]
MNTGNRYTGILIFVLLACFTSCIKSPYYQKEYSLPQNAWQYQFKPSFKFEITDTTAAYNLFLHIRHTEAYPFSNVWVWIYTKQPGDSSFAKSRIEIPLAEPTGKWMGRGAGEIWEQRLALTAGDKAMIFKKAGTYEIRMEQNMRINPLPEVLQVGLRVEKVARNSNGS